MLFLIGTRTDLRSASRKILLCGLISLAFASKPLLAQEFKEARKRPAIPS